LPSEKRKFPPANGWSVNITSTIKSHDNKSIYNASYIPMIPSQQAGLEELSFAYVCKFFVSTPIVIAIKDQGEMSIKDIRSILLTRPCAGINYNIKRGSHINP